MFAVILCYTNTNIYFVNASCILKHEVKAILTGVVVNWHEVDYV